MQEKQSTTTPVLLPADILTPIELAARLKVRTTWVYEKLRRRDQDPLPGFRCGRYLRFAWPQVSAWLLRQHAQPEKPSRRKYNRKAGRA